jgi:hypothetical protein
LLIHHKLISSYLLLRLHPLHLLHPRKIHLILLSTLLKLIAHHHLHLSLHLHLLIHLFVSQSPWIPPHLTHLLKHCLPMRYLLLEVLALLSVMHYFLLISITHS